jgi:gliding motility-associated-like protein
MPAWKTIRAQVCPPNLDFEMGNFSNWECYTGYTAVFATENVMHLNPSGGPVSGRHTMYSRFDPPQVDPYGGFPVVCPNGSGYSVRLGNDLAGTEAEGILYQFTIPANRNEYSLIYHYAVVFEDPFHLPEEQPRFVVDITNVTDNKLIFCSSFTFFATGTLLPGFFLSPNPPSGTPVWCKDWSAVSINLDGLAGKTIQLFFKTADCTFRRHFGYAYIDVNSECSGEFTGAAYCPGDTLVNVLGPYGYSSYTWFNSDFSQILGTDQILVLAPPPPPGTNIAVQVVPYHGYGCVDTLFARLIDTLTLKSIAGKDTLSCNGTPVPLGAPPKPGLVYSWSPSAGLSSPSISNPFASPASTTTYVLTTSSSGGGCIDWDTVVVKAAVINNSMQLIGSAAYCIDSNDSTILRVQPADSIQWYRNNSPIPGANHTDLRVIQAGNYHAVLFDNSGCTRATEIQEVFIEYPRPGINYPVQYAVINYPITLEARTFGVSYLWQPSVFLNTSSGSITIFNGTTEQLYTIEITSAAGCVTIDTQLVKTVKSVELYVPTAFTPNNDGKNDYLRPILMGVKELRYFRVYNRWGQLLYESRNPNPGWDGKLKGQLQGPQVFVWMAEGLGLDNRIHRRKGTVMLIR